MHWAVGGTVRVEIDRRVGGGCEAGPALPLKSQSQSEAGVEEAAGETRGEPGSRSSILSEWMEDSELSRTAGEQSR